MIAFVLVLAVLIGIPMLAVRGAGRRGAYLATAIISAALSFGCWEWIDTPPPLNPTVAEQRGQEVFDAIEFPLFLTYVAGVIGALIGAALFRPSDAGTKTCPHCAKRIQAAAVVCRFCGRSVQAPAPTT